MRGLPPVRAPPFSEKRTLLFSARLRAASFEQHLAKNRYSCSTTIRAEPPANFAAGLPAELTGHLRTFKHALHACVAGS